jgi:CheY-like chemotaxis protein
MYKLLLVTDREEVIDTFAKVHNLADMMMDPVTVIRDIPEAIAYLERNAVDAVGYSFRLTDPAPLHTYLMEVRPSMPIFQTHHHDNTLRDELVRVRAFLDRMRMDDSQEGMDEAQALQYLRDELMHRLLAREIPSPAELKSRLKLVRAQNISTDKPAFLFDFDMPQGELYLDGRWRYGRQRLESALRNNFIGRYADGIHYGVAMLSPRHIRLIACQEKGGSDENPQDCERRVRAYVEDKVSRVKQYLDLELELEQFTVLGSINEIADNNKPAEEDEGGV